MKFLVNRFLKDAVIIESSELEDFKFQASSFGEFSDADLEKVFGEKRRSGQIFSNDDNSYTIMRLTEREARPENIWLNVCRECAKLGVSTHVKSGHICDTHILQKYNLYEYLRVETCCCGHEIGEDVLPARLVADVLRKLNEKDNE